MATSRKTVPATITILDDVEKCEKEAIEGILALPPRKAVQIVINSGGGSVYASLAIIAAMRLRNLNAEAVVLADCSSAALLVLAACQRRLLAPHSSFLFHPMRWSSEEQARLTAAKSWAGEFDRLSTIFEDTLADELPIDRRTLRGWIRHEKYISAAELIDRGIAEPLDPASGKVIPIVRQRRKKAPARTPVRIRRFG
ncbi:MAG: ATP-dependent Clp protease proteolytic subunit [Candidatus Sumerlaeia bacterium]|nr:ATP-dependent Clp protease proteolytic subunit [Candidatus Sumerlaeia bacterium]